MSGRGHSDGSTRSDVTNRKMTVHSMTESMVPSMTGPLYDDDEFQVFKPRDSITATTPDTNDK